MALLRGLRKSVMAAPDLIGLLRPAAAARTATRQVMRRPSVQSRCLSTGEGSTPAPITVARGDGIGPEIMDSALKILEAGGAKLAIEEIMIGQRVYEQGLSAGIATESWDSLRRTKVFFKAPITTPQGGGFKSLNVTIRKGLGLFANVRPCRAYYPYVDTRHPNMDLVIVRENEEDLYAGIEHRQTDEVYQCLKLISRPGTERLVRYGFDYARAMGRHKVTCLTKDNIMKLTDGLFHKVFDQVGLEYPDMKKEHMIIDIGAARLADAPDGFDVVVTPNLYGDIVSDIAAEVAGSVGLAGSANLGEHGAMFEAIHGSAPDLAGKNVANPSGLVLAGVMMLVHLGQRDAAERIHNAWLKTIEDGVHTPDVYNDRVSTQKVGTDGFTDAVINRLGHLPEHLAAVKYDNVSDSLKILPYKRPEPQVKQLVGVDVFVEWRGDVNELAARLQAAENGNLSLKLITNRGVKVWPGGLPETFCTDHWRCRFHSEEAPQKSMIADLLHRIDGADVDTLKTENLYTFDGEPGYSLGQGQ